MSLLYSLLPGSKVSSNILISVIFPKAKVPYFGVVYLESHHLQIFVKKLTATSKWAWAKLCGTFCILQDSSGTKWRLLSNAHNITVYLL